MKRVPYLWMLMVVLLAGCSAQHSKQYPNPLPSTNTMEKQKILFVLTSHRTKGSTGEPTGYYLSEAAHPWKVLHDLGYEIDFVSPKGGEPPVDGFNLEDPVNKVFWEHPQVQTKLKNTLTPQQLTASQYGAIFYAGGHGTMWDFKDNAPLAQIAASIYEKNGVIGAVCHGPAALINIKLSDGTYLVDGKRVSAFTNEEEQAVGLTKVVPFLLEDALKERGAIFEKAENFQENVAVDGRLITGQNPASAHTVGQKMAEQLNKL